MKSIKILPFLVLFFFITSFDCNSKRMSKSKLLAKQGVYAVMPYDFEYDFKYRVLSYEWVYKSDGDIQTGKSIGSKYPPQLVRLIKAGKKDDILFVENVYVMGDDNYRRKILGMTIVIK